MEKHLVKHGNSMALVIEKPILDLLGVDAETPFHISTDGQALVLTPVQNKRRRKTFLASLEKVNARYAHDLKKLAE